MAERLYRRPLINGNDRFGDRTAIALSTLLVLH